MVARDADGMLLIRKAFKSDCRSMFTIHDSLKTQDADILKLTFKATDARDTSLRAPVACASELLPAMHRISLLP